MNALKDTPSPAVINLSVPTTKIMAVGRLTELGMSEKDRLPVLLHEVPATVQLYLDGKIDHWYNITNEPGVVFFMNVSTMKEASELLESLPFAKAGMMVFELTPVGPLSPLRILLEHYTI